MNSKKKTAPKPDWMNILGVMRIFTNENTSNKGKTFLTYSTSLSIKGDNDDWINYYLPVTFAKDCDVIPDEVGNVLIEVEGFLTVETYNDKKGNQVIKPKVVVMKSAEI